MFIYIFNGDKHFLFKNQIYDHIDTIVKLLPNLIWLLKICLLIINFMLGKS